MPVYNVTIDDASPLIQYDQWWTDSSRSDSLHANYSGDTFHTTEQNGGTARLTFNGSAVYLFGAKRPNHNVYAVTLDGQTTTANGYPGSSNANLFNQTLFSQTGLNLSQTHQISLTNTPSSSTLAYTDLDYVVITAGDGDTSTDSQDLVWDDDMAQYSPGWDDSPNGLQGGYFNNTMHRTNIVNAYATVTFEGNAVAVYGVTSTNHGFFNVSLDKAPPVMLNGTMPGDQPGPRYQNLLYWAGGLSSGQHTVTITNIDSNGLWLDLDKFVISRWPQTTIGGSSSGSAPSPTKSPGDHSGGRSHHNSTGAIVGGVVGGIIGAFLIALGLFLFLRRRSRHQLDRVEPTQERKDGGVLADTDRPLGSIEPFVATSQWSPSHERTPLQPTPVAGGFHAPTASSSDLRTLASSAGGTSKYILPHSPNCPSIYAIPASAPAAPPEPEPAPAAPPEPEPAPAPAPEPQPQPALEENPHQDFPPPNYEQATAASSSRGALPLPAPPVPPVPPEEPTQTVAEHPPRKL
ncbi:hypothetical protein PsYK624_107050 [Phanerochaete sordida]|uniref:Transmembrane protein n=1 Tax=Phanerochaete sordida TaxID=48140 RepID=A0A9P3GGI4_9APHY|nr:hypothetical protein PsYK624_107050 [Phanerochaete sordida]